MVYGYVQRDTTDHAPTRVVIDCDTGVDDAMAIFYGLLSPAIEIVGLTCCWGNIWVETATANTLRLLEIADMPDIPVAMGASKPLLGPMEARPRRLWTGEYQPTATQTTARA